MNAVFKRLGGGNALIVGDAVACVCDRDGTCAIYTVGDETPVSVEGTFAEVVAKLGLGGKPEEQSDGYHTFAELYEHRHALFLCLMASAPSLSWKARQIIVDSLRAAPVGNVRQHTAENLPAIIGGLVSENAELTTYLDRARARADKAEDELKAYRDAGRT